VTCDGAIDAFVAAATQTVNKAMLRRSGETFHSHFPSSSANQRQTTGAQTLGISVNALN